MQLLVNKHNDIGCTEYLVLAIYCQVIFMLTRFAAPPNIFHLPTPLVIYTRFENNKWCLCAFGPKVKGNIPELHPCITSAKKGNIIIIIITYHWKILVSIIFNLLLNNTFLQILSIIIITYNLGLQNTTFVKSVSDLVLIAIDNTSGTANDSWVLSKSVWIFTAN